MLVVPCHDGEAAVVGGWAVAECQLADLSLSSPLAQVSQPPVSSLCPLSSDSMSRTPASSYPLVPASAPALCPEQTTA